MGKDTQFQETIFSCFYAMDAKLWLDIHVNHKGVHMICKGTQGSIFLHYLLASEW